MLIFSPLSFAKINLEVIFFPSTEDIYKSFPFSSKNFILKKNGKINSKLSPVYILVKAKLVKILYFCSSLK